MLLQRTFVLNKIHLYLLYAIICYLLKDKRGKKKKFIKIILYLIRINKYLDNKINYIII